MAQYNERPIIMPMSNPTSKMECTHEEAQKYCEGRAIFASGSPQPDVEVDGKQCAASQANNMYIFPGLAMGAFLARGNIVTDGMLMAAAESLSYMITPEELAAGRVYPNMHKIREISLNVALETMKAAAEEGHLHNDVAIRELAKGDEYLRRYIQKHMYWPGYTNLQPPPPGYSD
jgi:malate dehydrogenase (decarboxylating)